jgi:hypothetical protein
MTERALGRHINARLELSRPRTRHVGELVGALLPPDKRDHQVGDEEAFILAQELADDRVQIDAKEIRLGLPPEQPLAKDEEAPEIAAGAGAQLSLSAAGFTEEEA